MAPQMMSVGMMVSVDKRRCAFDGDGLRYSTTALNEKSVTDFGFPPLKEPGN